MERCKFQEPTFPRFSQFPPEIRTMIWHLSIPDGRIVPIKYQSSNALYTPRIRPPSILHATRESRLEGLRVYHELKLGPYNNTGIYVDLTRDTVYMKSDLDGRSNRLLNPGDSNPDQVWNLSLLRPPIYDFFTFNPAIHSPNLDRSHIRDNNPLIPFRSHAKTILNDLFSSDDGLQIWADFYVEQQTWHLMQNYCRSYRHYIPAHPRNLCLVYERDDGLLSNYNVLSEIQPTFAQGWWGDAVELASNLVTINMAINKRDKTLGRPAVLTQNIKANYLDKVEGDVGIALLMNLKRAKE
jgi:hypothetical protein